MTEQTKSRGPRTEEAFEQLDSEARGVDAQTARRAAVAAVVAACAGALAGAVKAMLESRREEHGEDGREAAAEERDSGPEAGDLRGSDAADEGRQGAAQQGEAEQEHEARDPRGGDAADEGRQGAAQQGEAEHEHVEEPDEPGGDEREPEDDPEAEMPRSGLERLAASAEHDDPAAEKDERSDADDLRDADEAQSEAVDIVPKAREQLERLLGREAESVSGIERTDGHWTVSLEVVEMRRVPESTDVLASYEVVLDEDGRVARLRQTRRYRRSQVEAER
jgi:hypothetical protein